VVGLLAAPGFAYRPDRDRASPDAGGGWNLAVCVTDFPVHVGNRPVTAYASAASGVGLVSVPALGPVNLGEQVREAVLRIIDVLLGETVDDPGEAHDPGRHVRMRRRLEKLSQLTIGHPERDGRAVRFVAAVGLGNLRLLLGMVRANRPWRLIARPSRRLRHLCLPGLDRHLARDTRRRSGPRGSA
jgi:hypothetical protein